MRYIILSLIIFGVAMLCADEVSTAKMYYNYLNEGMYNKAFEMSSTIMQNALSEDKLKEIWETLPLQMGKLNGIIKEDLTKTNDMSIVILSLNFENAVMDMKITVDTEDKIAGLFFTMSSTPKPEEKVVLPDYLNKENITEEDIAFNCGNYKIKGKSVIPKDTKVYPVVLMITGSGPNDMDESIYSRKPFRDIAYGLGNKGIATVRWNKRTKDYPQIMNDIPDFTLEDEYITEVNSAIEWTKQTFPNRQIYLLGHSLGATIIPGIANDNNSFSGYIMMAGTAFKLEDVILEQYRKIFAMNGTDADENEILKQTEEQVKVIKNLTNDSVETNPLLLDLPKPYWLYLNSYDQVAEFMKMAYPILVMQGEKDYQVTMVDFKEWKSAGVNSDNFSFISYPLLDHLFMECKGKSTPDSYKEKKFVSKNVIKDISDWIKNHAG